jgi:hypothetical protein
MLLPNAHWVISRTVPGTHQYCSLVAKMRQCVVGTPQSEQYRGNPKNIAIVFQRRRNCKIPAIVKLAMPTVRVATILTDNEVNTGQPKQIP